LAFLGLVRIWAEWERGVVLRKEYAEIDVVPESSSPVPKTSSAPRSHRRSGGSSGWDWLNPLDWIDFDIGDGEGCIVLIVIIAAIGLAIGALVTMAGLIVQAEVVLAEVLLDAVLLSAFHRRLKKLQPRWWVASVVRQTIKPVACTAGLLMAVGIILQVMAPGATSIGDVWRHSHPPAPVELER
jgi:hypothetical protein